MKPTILIVEDDPGVQNFLRELLLDNGYNVYAVSDGMAATEFIEKTLPDIILLDLGLPGVSGESICSEIKRKNPVLPIIIVTAKDSTPDIVKGLGYGADDYITKPFNSEELLARITARLRQPGSEELVLKAGDLMLDRKALEVKREGKDIQLTPKEFKLLEYLLYNKGKVLTREMILNRIWLYSPDVETRVVDVYMGYLRKKIGDTHKKKLISSVRGFGYVIKEN